MNHIGLASQMPPAGYPGSTFTATDTGCVYTDDGTQWNVTDGYAQTLRSTTTTLTTAQIKNLAATYITLVPAPGVGKYVQVYDVFFYLNFGTVAFSATEVTAPGNRWLFICYGNPAQPGNFGIATDAMQVSEGNSTSAVLTRTSSGGFLAFPTSDAGGYGFALDTPPAENQPIKLVLRQPGVLTVGDSTLKVQVRYEVRPTTL